MNTERLQIPAEFLEAATGHHGHAQRREEVPATLLSIIEETELRTSGIPSQEAWDLYTELVDNMTNPEHVCPICGDSYCKFFDKDTGTFTLYLNSTTNEFLWRKRGEYRTPAYGYLVLNVRLAM